MAHDLACPRCGNDDQLYIDATTRVRLHAHGEIEHQDIEWTGTSPILCGQCGHHAQVQDFEADTPEGDCEP